jgi:hypothetical protein
MMVHEFPEHEKAGKMVLPPIILPCVLDVAGTEMNKVMISKRIYD